MTPTSSDGTTLRLAVVGLGYWGPNIARNFDRLPGAELRWICDSRPEALERVGTQLPGARQATSLDELLADGELDLALGGDAQLLEELPHRHVEDLFVHRSSFFDSGGTMTARPRASAVPGASAPPRARVAGRRASGSRSRR